MLKKIIEINEDLCIGCGACAGACHQGAIGIVDGVAKLLREDFCDGLGRCLPKCPTNAISFTEKEVDIKEIKKDSLTAENKFSNTVDNKEEVTNVNVKSQLKTWPIEIQLVAPNASFFDEAHLLISADCCAYAYANFHKDFMNGKVVVIGCPKLDDADYVEKLTNILTINNIKSVTVARMEVPCCSGLANATIKAVQNCGKDIPLNINIISRTGELLQ